MRGNIIPGRESKSNAIALSDLSGRIALFATMSQATPIQAISWQGIAEMNLFVIFREKSAKKFIVPFVKVYVPAVM